MVRLVLTHRPSPGNVNTPFGPRPKPTPRSPDWHYGEDYGWGNGLTIYAAAAGRVKSVGSSGAYGMRTVIEHAPGVETWYCHQSSTNVKVGDLVAGGQKIGVQGATGNVVGVHLHFEVRIDGRAVNPATYFRLEPAKSTTPKGGGASVAPPRIRKGPVTMIVIRSSSSYGFVPAGWTFVQGADGILRALDTKETNALVYNYPDLRVAEWSGQDVHEAAISNGLYEFTGRIDSGDPGSLTGKIIRGVDEIRRLPLVELATPGS